jgi:hypothetical protein
MSTRRLVPLILALRGVVDVRESRAPRPEASTRRGLTVEETCLER